MVNLQQPQLLSLTPPLDNPDVEVVHELVGSVVAAGTDSQLRPQYACGIRSQGVRIRVGASGPMSSGMKLWYRKFLLLNCASSAWPFALSF